MFGYVFRYARDGSADDGGDNLISLDYNKLFECATPKARQNEPERKRSSSRYTADLRWVHVHGAPRIVAMAMWRCGASAGRLMPYYL